MGVNRGRDDPTEDPTWAPAKAWEDIPKPITPAAVPAPRRKVRRPTDDPARLEACGAGTAL
ncbi:hypothetical protein GCM10027157_10980 [Corynebacterium aquatimens]